MKKVIPILILVILIPQIAAAAWWNPFSWKIFHKNDIKTQTLEDQVGDLKNQPENPPSTNELSKPANKEEKSSTVNITVTSPSNPVTPTDNKLKVETSTSITDLITKYSGLISIVKSERSYINKNSDSQRERDYYEFLDQSLNKMNADISYLSQIKNYTIMPSGIIELYLSKYSTLSDEYWKQNKNYEANIDEDKLQTEKAQIVSFIEENKYNLYIVSVHVEAAELLYLFDKLFGTKYSGEFESKKTQQDTLEFANRFLIDQK